MIEPKPHNEAPILFLTDHLTQTDVNYEPRTGREGLMFKRLAAQNSLEYKRDIIFDTLIPEHMTYQNFEGRYKRYIEGKKVDQTLPRAWAMMEARTLAKTNKIIVTDSRFVLEQMLGRSINDNGLQNYHSTVIEWRGRWVIPILPVVQTYWNNYLGTYTTHRDLAKISEMYYDATWNMDRTRRTYNINPSIEQIRHFFHLIKGKGEYAFDIETTIVPDKPDKLEMEAYIPQAEAWHRWKHVTSMGFSIDKQFALVIPFEQWLINGEFDKWAEAMLLVTRLLSIPEVTCVMQNSAHEIVQLLQLHRIEIRNKIEDVMIAHSVLYPELPKGLKYLIASFTWLPYYKDDGKKHFLAQDEQGLELLFKYNGTDACGTWEVYNDSPLMENVKDPKFWKTYRKHIDLVYPLTYMEVNGVRYNQAAEADIKEYKTMQVAFYKDVLRWMHDKKPIKVGEIISPDGEELLFDTPTLKAHYDRLKEEFGEPVSKLNPNSRPQMIQFLYTDRGLTPYKNVSKDKFGQRKSVDTVDDKALQKLARPIATRPAIQEARVLQKYRKANKLLGTYLSFRLGLDGRFHAGWNSRGTKYSRLSSNATLDGVGGNMQNLTLMSKEYFAPDDGNIFYEFDLSQAEWVITGYEAGETKMIHVFMHGLDAHAVTASMISRVPQEMVKEEQKLMKDDPELLTLEKVRQELCAKYGIVQANHFFPRTMIMRQCGKKSNHSLDYDISEHRFSMENEIPLNEAKIIKPAYLRAYPNLKFYFGRVQRQMSDERMLSNCFGRHHRFLKQMTDQYYKEGYSYGPQSTVGDVTTYAMLDIYEEANSDKPYPREFWKGVQMNANVHDSLLMQRPNRGWQDAFKFCMEMRSKLHVPITIKGLTFKLKVDVKIGHESWFKMKELKLEDHNKLKGQLHKYFMDNQLEPKVNDSRYNAA